MRAERAAAATLAAAATAAALLLAAGVMPREGGTGAWLLLACGAWAAWSAWRPEAALVALAALLPLTGHASLRAAAGAGEVAVPLWLGLATLAGLGARGARDRSDDGVDPRRMAPWPAAWRVVVVLFVAHLVGRGAVAFLRFSEGWPLTGTPFRVEPINTLGEPNVPTLIRIGVAVLVGAAGPLLALGAARTVRRTRTVARLVTAFAGALVAAAAIGAVAIARGDQPASVYFANRAQFAATFVDPNALGTAALVAAPFLLTLLAQGSGAARAAAAAGLAATTLLLLVSGSRTGAAGALLGGAATLILLARERDRAEGAGPGRRWSWVALALLLVLGAAVAGVTVARGGGEGGSVGLLRRAEEGAQVVEQWGIAGIWRADRVHHWRRALRVVAAEPWGGVGPGAYEAEQPNIFAWVKGWEEYRDNALNQFLHVAAETGWPGLALFLAAWGGLVAVAVARATRRPAAEAGPKPVERDAEAEGRAWARALAVALVVLTLAFMTGAHLVHAESNLLVWLLAGAVAGATRPREGAEAATPPRRGRSAALAAGVLLGALAAGSLGAAAWHARGAGSLRATLLPTGTWRRGLHEGAVSPDGATYDFWTSTTAEFSIVRGEPTSAILLVGHPDAASRPVDVRVEVAGGAARTFHFAAPGAPERLELVATPSEGERFALVRVAVSRGWVPATTDATSGDTRELGVLFRVRLEPAAP